MIFQTLDTFQKDLKKLSKKYSTLKSDIEVVKKILAIHPEARPPFSFQLQGLGIEIPIIKIKKIASRSFKGRGVQSGFRLVYAYFPKEERIVFIELFHKTSQTMEDRQRIHIHFN
jgi:mRNA-degrading endonuclease RelE of RelBE toxin-antitoxin system